MTVIELVSSLIPTYLIRRLILWITRKWNGGINRLVLANVLFGLFCAVLGGYGYANGGPFNWLAFGMYSSSQGIWLVIDTVGFYRKPNSIEDTTSQ